MSRRPSEELPEYKKFKDGVSQHAEERLKDLFPQKVLDLEEILKVFSSIDFSSTGCDLGLRGSDQAPTNTSQSTSPPCNSKIVSIIDQLKPEIVFVLEQLNGLKMWIQLNIPKVQDGNNFGVAIQSETVSELVRIESDVAALYEAIPQYFISRAKLVTRCLKYPQIEDHRQTVMHLDVKEMENLYLTCAEIRNIYCCLHDMLLKNLEKLKKPRNAGPNMMMY